MSDTLRCAQKRPGCAGPALGLVRKLTVTNVDSLRPMHSSIYEVFVVGGLPRVTYVAREALELERRLREYLDERYKILSLAGPTKSGKTVLVRHLVPDAVELPGAGIDSIETFWATLVDELGGYPEETRERSEQDSTADERSGGGGVNAIVKADLHASKTVSQADGKRQAFTRKRPDSRVARERLAADRDAVIFIDDFHYILPDVQLPIVRALKAPVFDGTRVILASVPHRAFDAVRVEKEMTGRVQPLEIPLWSERDLRGIAAQGFEALNVGAPTPVVNRMAAESFGSPLLMQDFCLQFCKENGVGKRQEARKLLKAPDDFAGFFRDRATGASKTAFDLLAQGPRQRADRLQRLFADGRRGDIYEGVLAAIAATGPTTNLPYEQLRTSLRNVLGEEAPQRHEVTRVLDQMTKIAKKIEGEPVIEYDEEYDMIYLSDPFFAFYLRWGTPAGAGK
jgi:hypothetical protein